LAVFGYGSSGHVFIVTMPNKMSEIPPNHVVNKKKIIHVGYELCITDEIKQKLLDSIPNSDDNDKCNFVFLKKPIVAVLHRTSNEEMSAWYTTAGTKKRECYAQGIFATDKYLVLHCTIGGLHQWVTVVKGTNIQPLQLKKKISNGDLGQEIPIEKIQIPCVPYIF
jgi:hypothetical protein